MNFKTKAGREGDRWTPLAPKEAPFLITTELRTWHSKGWWLSYDIGRLQHSAEVGKIVGTWVAIALVAAVAIYLIWRARARWQPAAVRVNRAKK